MIAPRLVYSLIACVLLISAPHAAHLPLWVSVSSAALLGWRGFLAYTGRPQPARLLPLLVIAAMGGILASFHTLFGRDAGVTMLVLLAAFKLFELRTKRDATVVLYLASFVSITHFLYSQSMLMALFMLATLLAIVTTWMHLQSPNLALPVRTRIASQMLLQAIPLTLVLFILFPRVQGPLWGMPPDAYVTTGLDDKMSPGSVSKLSLSDAVAFRVTFEGAPPPQKEMYWRGPVLWDYDGQTWTPGNPMRAKSPQLDQLAHPVDYTITLEPHNKTWLFTLEMPVQISLPAVMTADFQVLQKENVHERVRYTARSALDYRANAEESVPQLLRALAIPRNTNPRALELAAEWRRNLGDEERIVRAALDFFNHENFQYTLTPPLLSATNGIDEFLFGTRKGFCEHYASSFVFLMRAAGMPARVVTGYQGGEFNPLGNYYTVRQSDAHAWAEVWMRGHGWVRVDPTAAIAPSRIERGIASALPQSDNAILPLMVRTQSLWLISLHERLDALTYQWNQWVLGYNPARQLSLLTALGMKNISWQKMALTLLAGMALLFGLFTLITLRTLKVKVTDEALRLYLKYCRQLAKHGVKRAPAEGPRDFAQRAAGLKPQLTDDITAITAHYLSARYGKAGNTALQDLRRRVAAFKL